MLPMKRSAIALARGARIGVLSTLTPIAVKTASKGGGELGVAIPDQVSDLAAGVVEVHQEVADLLARHRSGGR
jgi:hypothetical protein